MCVSTLLETWATENCLILCTSNDSNWAAVSSPAVRVCVSTLLATLHPHKRATEKTTCSLLSRWYTSIEQLVGVFLAAWCLFSCFFFFLLFFFFFFFFFSKLSPLKENYVKESWSCSTSHTAHNEELGNSQLRLQENILSGERTFVLKLTMNVKCASRRQLQHWIC